MPVCFALLKQPQTRCPASKSFQDAGSDLSLVPNCIECSTRVNCVGLLGLVSLSLQLQPQSQANCHIPSVRWMQHSLYAGMVCFAQQAHRSLADAAKCLLQLSRQAVLLTPYMWLCLLYAPCWAANACAAAIDYEIATTDVCQPTFLPQKHCIDLSFQ